jgi:1-deoxy-D-xylulose-5-phosphate reductoisomerase
MSNKILISLLGATGSVGKSVLAVLDENPDIYRLFAVSAYSRVEQLLSICERYHPVFAVVQNESQASWLQRQCIERQLMTEVLLGPEGLCTVARDPAVQVVVAGIVGVAGLPSTMAAAKAGKRILLANKEALVVAGDLLLKTVKEHGAELLPLDSEHSAIFQVMPPNFQVGVSPPEVRKIILTASGGPFRNCTLEQMKSVTPHQACQHPTWSMGPKISVACATLMNKGLELIEGCWLFGLSPNQVDVLIHPQSIIHSMVEMIDGSVLAQMGPSNMQIPIAHCLGYPNRIPSGATPLDWYSVHSLTFEPVDESRFPALQQARAAFLGGQGMPCVLNAANEIAIEAFLSNRISFLQMTTLTETLLAKSWPIAQCSLEGLLALDQEVRQVAEATLSANSD